MDAFIKLMSALAEKGAKTMYVAAAMVLATVGLTKLLHWDTAICIGVGLFAGAITWNIYDLIIKMLAARAKRKDPTRIIEQIFARIAAEHSYLIQEANMNFRNNAADASTAYYLDQFKKLCERQHETIATLQMDEVEREMTMRRLQGRMIKFKNELAYKRDHSWMQY